MELVKFDLDHFFPMLRHAKMKAHW